ncbi:hypothetical protein KZ829_28965 [Actinoplanes hulinensis]|uniref:Uncharacterized protein n=1 Tax=Actinoplanes hulinensis TaxID=1144547 RepID=A0ABS7B9N0_9ACTN|nr:hypothetical protein [Actinoplanes hulinensis]MBW6437774.1 hypothetical protein [Actinoplanes hulinensis]
MKPLSELLQEAKVDAPPPRYDVDHVVAAGRRRIRRRNSGWALAAVVAVAITIGVPQIVSRSAAPVPQPPAASATQAPAPTLAPDHQIPSVFRFHGYQTASFKIGDPTSVGPGYTGTWASPIENGRKESRLMSLVVYEPGVDPVDRLGLTRVADVAPVKGRPAFTVSWPAPYDGQGLVWEYADNAFAVLTPDPTGAKLEEMREVAEGFGLSAERPVLAAFKVGYLPGDFRLRAVNQESDEFSAVHFLPVSAMREPVRKALRRYEAINGTEGSIQIVLQSLVPGGAAGCGCLAYRKIGDGHEVSISGAISKAEARKILDSLEVATPGDYSTWVPVAQMVPEEYLYKGE